MVFFMSSEFYQKFCNINFVAGKVKTLFLCIIIMILWNFYPVRRRETKVVILYYYYDLVLCNELTPVKSKMLHTMKYTIWSSVSLKFKLLATKMSRYRYL